MKIQTLLLTCVMAVSLSAGENLLNTVPWRIAVANGGKMSVARQGDVTIVERTSNQGSTIYLPRRDFPITPGKTYEATIRFKSLTPGAKAAVMVQTNDKTRRPFPNSGLKEFRETGVASIRLTARDTEKTIRIMLTMSAPGKIAVENVELNEITPQCNLLQDPVIKWGYRVRNGATGKVTYAPDKTITLNRTNSAGQVLIVSDTPVDLAAGNDYTVSMDLVAGKEPVSARMVLQFPGSKRRVQSVPVKLAAGAQGTAKFSFTADADEKLIKIHLYLDSTGSVQVKKIDLSKKKSDPVTPRSVLQNLNCDGKTLLKYFVPVQLLRRYNSPFPDAEVRAYTGGFICRDVNVPAAQVKVIEVDFRAFGQGGALRLDFVTEYDGKRHRSFRTASVVPDGEFHTVRFPVALDPVWKGTLRELQLSWQSLREPGRISFSAMRSFNDSNVISNAAKIFQTGALDAEYILPRGIYRFTRRSGDTPEYTLEFFDRRGKKIGSETLKSGEKSRRFTAPEMLVSTRLTTTAKSGGEPLIELIELPVLDKSIFSWRGKWIWSRSGSGPNRQVARFEKTITLTDAPAEAVIAGTGDDDLSVIVNGKKVPVTNNWTEPHLVDLTGLMKKGENVIQLEVFNHSAWGGVIADFYVREVNGKEWYFATDDTWRCSETASGKIDGKVHVVGPVPVSPWGSRFGFCYAGARGELRLKPLRDNVWEAEILAVPPVATDKFDFLVTLPDGSKLNVVGTVTPGSGQWKTGEKIELSVTLPEISSRRPGTGKISFNSPLLRVDGLPATVTVPARRKQPLSTLKIVNTGKRPYFVLNGKKEFPFYFILPSTFITQPGRMGYLVRNTRKSGCSIARLTFGIRHAWIADGQWDFSALDRALTEIANIDPDLKIILSVPCFLPEWYLEKNPDAAIAFFSTKKRSNEDAHSIASEKYEAAMAEFFNRLQNFLENSAHNSRIVGISPVDGVTSEWLWAHGRGHGKRMFSGWEQASLDAYRKYLRRIYGNDPAKLAAAWKKPGVTFDNALPPAPDRIDNASVGDMLDPQRDKDIIEWSDFRNECLANAFITMCRMGKSVGNNRWIAGAYYGYINMLSWMHNYLQDSGHMRIAEVARSPHVDYVIGPTLYHWRTLGNGDGMMQPAESFSAHGTAVVAELDLRTYTEPNEYETRNGRMSTPEMSVSAINRTMGMLFARGCAGHWLEMYDRWFREPMLLDLLKSYCDLYMSLPEEPAGTVTRDVCVVSDQRSTAFVRTNHPNGIHVLLIAEFMRRMPEIGVGFNHIITQDLVEPGRIEPQKFYIITNLFAISAADRQAMLKRFEKERATVLWLYAPGVSFPDRGPDARFASELLGITLAMDNVKKNQLITFADPEKWGVKEFYSRVNLAPWFTAVSGFDEVIARTSEGKPALVKWQRNGVTNYFCTIPNPPPEVLRRIAAEAGAKVWIKSGDPIWAGNDFVTVHARTGGSKQLDLPAGMAARSVIGPDVGTLRTGESFDAKAGITYGFIVTRE